MNYFSCVHTFLLSSTIFEISQFQFDDYFFCPSSDVIMGVYCGILSRLEWITWLLEWRKLSKFFRNEANKWLYLPQNSLKYMFYTSNLRKNCFLSKNHTFLKITLNSVGCASLLVGHTPPSPIKSNVIFGLTLSPKTEWHTVFKLPYLSHFNVYPHKKLMYFFSTTLGCSKSPHFTKTRHSFRRRLLCSRGTFSVLSVLVTVHSIHSTTALKVQIIWTLT